MVEIKKMEVREMEISLEVWREEDKGERRRIEIVDNNKIVIIFFQNF